MTLPPRRPSVSWISRVTDFSPCAWPCHVPSTGNGAPVARNTANTHIGRHTFSISFILYSSLLFFNRLRFGSAQGGGGQHASQAHGFHGGRRDDHHGAALL